MKTRRTVRRKQKGGFDERLAKIWRQRLRFADSFHDFHKVNSRVQENLRESVNKILTSSISVSQLQYLFPIVTNTLANYENGIHDYLLGTWESELILDSSDTNEIVFNKFSQMYNSLFGSEYSNDTELLVMCDAGLAKFGNFLSEVNLNPNAGDIVYIITPATIADSASSIGPTDGLPFRLSEIQFKELADEEVNIFGRIPILFQTIKTIHYGGMPKRAREGDSEEGPQSKRITNAGLVNITFSQCLADSCCQYSYPLSLPDTSKTGPSVHELSKAMVKTSGLQSTDRVDKRYRSFLDGIQTPGSFFDIKRAGDYHQVLSALALQKENNKIIFTTIDILCATYAILHGIPTIFQYKGKFRWHSKQSLDALILPTIQ